jgi:hypothetical protein
MIAVALPAPQAERSHPWRGLKELRWAPSGLVYSALPTIWGWRD